MRGKRPLITEKTAASVIQHYFGTKPKSVCHIGGLSNFVFEAKLHDKELVVRLSDRPDRLQFFLKEQWAVRKAREFKVPVPEILEVGNELDGTPYMVLEKIRGPSAEDCVGRIPILKQLAEHARVINSIPTTGFGHVFDWSKNELSRNESWKEFLHEEFGIENRLKLFRKAKIFSATDLRKLEKAVATLEKLNFKPRLNHGDLRLKNVILDEKNEIKAIIDWEHCLSGPVPEWDLSIALHDLSIDEKEAFLESYGISLAEFTERSATVKLLNILNYGKALTSALKLKNRQQIASIKARLNGVFDLFSIC